MQSAQSVVFIPESRVRDARPPARRRPAARPRFRIDSPAAAVHDPGVQQLTAAQLKERAPQAAGAGDAGLEAAIDVQLASRVEKTTKGGKPYLELGFADATGSFALKAWSDSELFRQAGGWSGGEFLRLSGRWAQSQYGLEAARLTCRALDAAQRAAFLAGDPETRARQEHDWETITGLCATLRDPRLAALCGRFLADCGDRFRRTAAARRNHHARRGGLVEHVAQMMRAADALCRVYPRLNRDLLLAGVLVHDCGKMWENGYPEEGFNQAVSLHGEMLGHIPLGIEVVNRLWRDLAATPEARDWPALDPASEDVRVHLLHLIGSHHGQHEFGSPVLPRTPEAFALHYLDNLDAKLEMASGAYATAAEVADGIYDRVFPLPAGLVRPLAACPGAPPPAAAAPPPPPAGAAQGDLFGRAASP